MSILIRNIAPRLNTPRPDEDWWEVLIDIVITVVACVVEPELAPVIFEGCYQQWLPSEWRLV